MVPKIEAAPKRALRIATVAVGAHLVLRATWSAGPGVGKDCNSQALVVQMDGVLCTWVALCRGS
jgi:hypothetical protein